MIQEQWTAVDDYTNSMLVHSDAVLDLALKASVEAGLPAHNVSPSQGKFLNILARSHGAKKILELGTLGGYSTIWLARALPEGGKLITIENTPKHAELAARNIFAAGLSGVVEIRTGKALDVLPEIAKQDTEPFDLIFIDADKPNNPDYFKWALRLSRPGSLILIDNVIRDGRVADADNNDPSIVGVRQMNELISVEKRVVATSIQTVGSKGYDGFTLALVTEG